MWQASKALLGAAVVTAFVSACAGKGHGDLVATFYDMSDTQFSVQAIAPPSVIREYAVCKAVWFAEKKRVGRISLSDPSYDKPVQRVGQIPAKVPDGWTVLNATAYLDAPNPDGNPTFSVVEKSGPCRQAWDWYR
jgi:hypothetical protein